MGYASGPRFARPRANPSYALVVRRRALRTGEPEEDQDRAIEPQDVLVIEPSDEALERWRQRAEIASAALRALDQLRTQPAVTADGGKFELRGVPPGTYSVEAVHEKLGRVSLPVTRNAMG